MNKQKIFEFEFNNIESEVNFYVNKTNLDAYNAIFYNKNNNIFLIGPAKSGKSFLGKIWLNKNKAIKYDKNFDYIIANNKNILVDDINSNINQENLFHIINHCKLLNLKILIVSNYNINELNFSLKDLDSRLKIFSQYKINKPDDDMLLNILTKLFIENQFIIKSHEIFDFILKRANRSYADMYNIVKKLDSLSIEKKRQLTIPLIKEIL